jgi:transketolase
MRLDKVSEIIFSESKILQWARLGSRAVYGQALLELADSNHSIIAISADLGNSSGLDRFKNAFPDRFINVGIAEQNMIGVASGLAKEGFTVFASSFAPFISFRSGEQIRMNLGYMRHNVKAVGIGSGLAMGFLGNSHFGTEDLAVILAIPNITVISPSDTTEVVKAVIESSNFKGPVYIRLTGLPGDPIVNHSDYDFEIGKINELVKGNQVSIIATGSMVAAAVEASRILSDLGVSASVANMHTLKPIDSGYLEKLIIKRVPIYTVEEHSLVGGLGSTVASFVSEKDSSIPIKKLGIPDQYGETGDYAYLKNLYGLTADAIASRIILDIRG